MKERFVQVKEANERNKLIIDGKNSPGFFRQNTCRVIYYPREKAKEREEKM